MTITPAPSSLGLESPALGPWFEPDVTLAVPRDDLSVPVDAATERVAYPPAIGVLGYHVAADPPPGPLRLLRDATGAAAFATGNLVALFTLLPEVEQRLFTLAQSIPQALQGTAPAGTPTRATVRHLAYEFGPARLDLLAELAAPAIEETAPGATPAEQAAHLGLDLADDGVTLQNGAHPMTDLHVPGTFLGAERVPMMDIGTEEFMLWAFDDGGRAIDPGAVASWWNHMAKTIFNNLWAPGDPDRTAGFAARLTVHLVNPAEGPLDPDLLGRVNASALQGSGVLLRWNGSSAAALAFTAAPDRDGGPDDAPVPAMAVLPGGTYAAGSPITSAALTLYPNGPVHADLTRDYVRVGVVDVERHLVGQARTAPTGSGDAVSRRAADQNRQTTRVAVNRVAPAGLVLHTTIDTAVAALLAGLGGNATTLVLPPLDREFASLAVPTLPTALPPTAPPTITAEALTGGGAAGGDQGNRINGQIVLLRLRFDGWPNAVSGAWVRVWPRGFDLNTGRHVPLDGGAGVTTAESDGTSATADVVVTLPDGVVDSPDAPRDDIADLMCDVSVVTDGNATTTFADVRFTRPDPVGGSKIDIDDADGLVVCEVGPVSATTALRPGSTLFSVEDDGTFALVDRASVDAAGFAASIDAAVTADDVVVLTEPAWTQSASGDVLESGDLAAGTVRRANRDGLNPLAAGGPHPTMEFLDAAAASTAPAAATIGAAVGLRRHHELPPHMLGHPGAPAAREVAGAGVSLTGPAALVVAEHTRDRANPGLPALINAATAAAPTGIVPTAPTPWVAVLGTIGFGVDGELGVAEVVRLAAAGLDEVQDILSSLEGVVNGLPSTLDLTGDLLRAISRRLLSAGWGLREAATSLNAAFARAEDLVYLETPAIDTLPVGGDGDTISPVQTLVDRLEQRPALHVVLCMPRRAPAGWPAKLGRVRDALARQAIAALETKAPGRIGVFHPAAGRDRALDLAATAVVVDDTYAMIGTSHLWRRGLSFDRGLAASVFDERLTLGRPTAVRAFRLALLAQRLGTTVPGVPLDPFELVRAVRELAGPGAGFGRATTGPITMPDPVPTDPDVGIWNRDGSAVEGLDPFLWLLDGHVQSEFENEVP
jgi:hypothetical protein